MSSFVISETVDEKPPMIPSMTSSTLDTKTLDIGIIGTGDYGRALGKRLIQFGYKVRYGSRNPSRRFIQSFQEELTVATIGTIRECIENVDVVFICVSGSKHGTLATYKDSFKNKIIVDVSNPEKVDREDVAIAQKLQLLIPDGRVVKALNTLSAYSLIHDDLGPSKPVPVFSNDREAKTIVKSILEGCGLHPLDGGKLERAIEVEKMSLVLLGQWAGPLIFTLAVFIFWLIICLIRYYFLDFGRHRHYTWSRFPTNTLNKVFACVSLTLLATCYLPGAISAYIQLIRGTKYKPFSAWLDRWLKARKQIGLLSLFCAGIHVGMSLAIFNADYFSALFNRSAVSIPINENTTMITYYTDSKLTWEGETLICFGVLTFACMFVIGLTSVPEIGNRLTWRQWNLIQSGLGLLSLIMGTAHALMRTVSGWDPESLLDSVADISLYTSILPGITILMKLILYLPCIFKEIRDIRSGVERPRAGYSNASVEPEGLENVAMSTL